jgi:hypothetical protein
MDNIKQLIIDNVKEAIDSEGIIIVTIFCSFMLALGLVALLCFIGLVCLAPKLFLTIGLLLGIVYSILQYIRKLEM